MDSEKNIKQLKQKLEKYQRLQKTWRHQKETLTKSIVLMQQQINKQKAFNFKLLKKKSHKRTCSDELKFIYSQPNVSSYYPLTISNKINNWVLKANLRSHLDSVRTVLWQGKFLLTAGEDCLLKIWERDKLRITVRQHLAPIFTMCGDNQSIFTAGAQGVVRQWSVQTFLQNGRPITEAELHDDSIWQMIWNHHNRILVTSSSDGLLKIIKSNKNQLKQLEKINLNPQTPTSISFISGQSVATGFVQNKKISLFDLQKTQKILDISYQSKQQISQTNKILYMNRQKALISGHQDRIIRFCDINSGKIIKSIVAHSDAVTSLCIRSTQNNQLISVSNDGSIRIWDIRKYKCINDIGIHMQKYDQSLLCVAYNVEEQIVAVGGADGQIKLLCPQI